MVSARRRSRSDPSPVSGLSGLGWRAARVTGFCGGNREKPFVKFALDGRKVNLAGYKALQSLVTGKV